MQSSCTVYYVNDEQLFFLRRYFVSLMAVCEYFSAASTSIFTCNITSFHGTANKFTQTHMLLDCYAIYFKRLSILDKYRPDLFVDFNYYQMVSPTHTLLTDCGFRNLPLKYFSLWTVTIKFRDKISANKFGRVVQICVVVFSPSRYSPNSVKILGI